MSCSVAIPTSPSPAVFASPEATTVNSPCLRGVIPLRASPPRAFGFARDKLPPIPSSLSFNRVNPKRKRALLIEIPKENERKNPLAVGEELRSDGRREVIEEGLGFAVCSKRGKKKLQMEDRHLAMPYFNGIAKAVCVYS